MKIYFLNGLMNGTKIELSGERVRIGRETDNDIIIETEGVSRYHAELIHKDGDNWALKDLGSTNGSKVNSEKISNEKLLRAGDVVTLGDQKFRMGEKKSEPETKTEPPVIPIIQADNKSESPSVVKKIVFQPIVDSNVKTSPEKKKPEVPEPIIPTVKTEPPVQQKEKAEDQAILTAKELSESVTNIFGPSEEKAETKTKNSEHAVKRHVLNILFYLSLLVAVAVFVFWFLNANPHPKSTVVNQVVEEKPTPLVLNYVKTKVTADNIFRFSLLVENNSAKFTIDDLKADRHYNKTIKEIKPELLNVLKDAIEETKFMDLQPVSSGSVINNLDETRVLTIALKNNYNSITIRNNSAQRSFEAIENAIDDFADSYDMLTFAMTPAELKKRAELSFAKAEQYYANRMADSSNFLEAERRYKMTIDYLDQFTPKPEIWDVAKKRYEEVKALRKKRWDELSYEVERLQRLGKIEEAIAVLDEMKDLTPVDSALYKRVRRNIIILSERLKARRK